MVATLGRAMRLTRLQGHQKGRNKTCLSESHLQPAEAKELPSAHDSDPALAVASGRAKTADFVSR